MNKSDININNNINESDKMNCNKEKNEINDSEKILINNKVESEK